MKILMLITQLGYGGAEGAFLRLANELGRRHEVEIVVFTTSYGGGYTDAPLAHDLPLHVLDHPKNRGRVARWFRRWRGLRRRKSMFAADVTISFLTGPNALNAIAGGTGLTIVSIRGSRLFDFNSAPWARKLIRTLVDPVIHWRADAIVSVSTGLSREVSGGRMGPGTKFHTIAGYVDSAAILASATAAIEPELEPLSRQPLIVTAGRLSREKGVDHLLRMFARVRHEVDGAKLLVIGDGPQLPELIDYCAAHGLQTATGAGNSAEADVIFLGYRSEPNRYFRLARAFVLPSLSEGFPNILVEALGAAIPVIVADTPWGSSDVVGVERGTDNRPYPRSAPLTTEYGLLMPRIDDPAYEGVWAEALVDFLERKPGLADRTALFHERVRLYSCANAAERWNGLVRHLTDHRAGRPTTTVNSKEW